MSSSSSVMTTQTTASAATSYVLYAYAEKKEIGRFATMQEATKEKLRIYAQRFNAWDKKHVEGKEEKYTSQISEMYRELEHDDFSDFLDDGEVLMVLLEQNGFIDYQFFEGDDAEELVYVWNTVKKQERCDRVFIDKYCRLPNSSGEGKVEMDRRDIHLWRLFEKVPNEKASINFNAKEAQRHYIFFDNDKNPTRGVIAKSASICFDILNNGTCRRVYDERLQLWEDLELHAKNQELVILKEAVKVETQTL